MLEYNEHFKEACMVVLSCTDIEKSFGTTVILDKISFSINEGEKVGLIGKNGAGKSTLFKILTGDLDYDHGHLYQHKDVSLGYLKQNVVYQASTTLYEFCLEVFKDVIALETKLRDYELKISAYANDPEQLNEVMNTYTALTDEFNHINGYAYKSELRGVLFGLGFKEEDFDRPIATFSGGQQSRISIAKLLLTKPNILLLDEPTNHLDINAVKWLEGYLKNYTGTIVLISHDRYFLDQVVNKVFEIDQHKLLSNPGNYTDFVAFKKIHLASLQKQYENQQKYIKEQETLISKFKERGTEKLAKRAKSREKRLDMIEVLDRPTNHEERAKLKFSTQLNSGTDVLFIENLQKDFDKTIFKDVSFNVYKGEKIGLIGDNGVGKTSLFKILLDEHLKTDGEITYGHNVHMGYFSQDQLELNDENDLIDEISDVQPQLDLTQIRTLLGSFLFKGDDVFKIVNQLSGGEKSRLSLLKLMLSKANLLLLDEPTNHLDIISKEALEDALMSYDGTILSISHDRYYLNKISSKIIELKSDGVKEYLGNYDYYQSKKELQAHLETPFEKEQLTKTQIREQRKKEKEEQKQKKIKRQAFEALENDIHLLEARIGEIEVLMCDESVYSNPERSKELHNEMNTLKIELEEKYETWETHIE